MNEDPAQDPGAPAESVPPAENAVAAETPEARLATLEKEKNDARERMLRIAAEFENWKKRSRKEMADAQVKGKELVLKDVLDVFDNLERAVASAADIPQAKPIVEGVNLVLRLFQGKMERHDVKAIEAKGKPFDPRLHEAISRQVTTEMPAGQVLSEYAKGYMIGDRLLRPASVVVAVPPPVEKEAPADAAEAGDVGGGGDTGSSSGSASG